jgi:hypothetical protein
MRPPRGSAGTETDATPHQLLKTPKVTGGESFDDRVVLKAEGEMLPGMNARALVRMLREAGAWRYDGGATVGMLRDGDRASLSPASRA